MMQNDVPAGYVQAAYFSPPQDRRLRRRLNCASFLLAAVLIFLGWLWQGFTGLTALLREGFRSYLLWVLLLFAAFWLCFTLHQLTHALLLRLLSGAPALIARKGLCLFAGSNAFLRRGAYLAAVLLPPLLWSAVPLLVCLFLSGHWFWLAYGVFLLSFGSSLDDLLFASLALRREANALYRYRGFAAGVYTEER